MINPTLFEVDWEINDKCNFIRRLNSITNLDPNNIKQIHPVIKVDIFSIQKLIMEQLDWFRLIGEIHM